MAAERIELPFTLINVDLQAAELHSNFHEKETEDEETTFVLGGKLYTHYAFLCVYGAERKSEIRTPFELSAAECIMLAISYMRTTVYTES
jgi:hypothetical protein